jgi:DNA-binding SARP family transcriptional activator
MNSSVETTSRATIPAWARAALALLALTGLAALAIVQPPLPALPWQPLQPTREELLRQSLVFALWLLLLCVCLRLAWLAFKPPRRTETHTHSIPTWLPQQRRPRRHPQPPDARELLQVFSQPRPIAAAAAVAATSPINADTTDDRPAEESATGSSRVIVRLFGRLRIEGVDEERPSERATRGLIAYLLLRRAPATLDELTEALWPGENPAKTRQRLWKAKRQAQRLLGDVLIRNHDSYAIDHTRLRTDIDELDQLRKTAPLKTDQLEQAITLTQDEPLADVDYPWADSERRRLQAIRAELLEQLASERLEHKDAHGALAAAERLIQLDPLNERGWCLAMQAEGALGNRQAILDRYERLTSELDSRLGLTPSAGAKQTYRRLLAQT